MAPVALRFASALVERHRVRYEANGAEFAELLEEALYKNAEKYYESRSCLTKSREGSLFNEYARVAYSAQ